MEFIMEFPIYYIILETMLTLTSTFGVLVIVIVQGSFLLLAYLWGAYNVMKEYEAEREFNCNPSWDDMHTPHEEQGGL
jgi:hypothetical protein